MNREEEKPSVSQITAFEVVLEKGEKKRKANIRIPTRLARWLLNLIQVSERAALLEEENKELRLNIEDLEEAKADAALPKSSE